jgi:hypothetical protein
MLAPLRTILIWDSKTQTYREKWLWVWLRAINNWVGLAIFASKPGVVIYVLGLFTLFWRVSATPYRGSIDYDNKGLGMAAEAAELGAKVRQRLLTLIKEVEAKLGRRAIAFSENKGALMTRPELITEIESQHDGKLLLAALRMCFPTPDAAHKLAQTWHLKVRRLSDKTLSDESLRERSSMLATYILYNLDTYLYACSKSGISVPRLTQTQYISGRLEEAALWLCVVSKASFTVLKGNQRFFMECFAESLSNFLALEGATPQAICEIMSLRSVEYARYKDWVPLQGQDPNGTLLWEAAKNTGSVIAAKQNPLFLRSWGMVFLQRYENAKISELLSSPTGG